MADEAKIQQVPLVFDYVEETGLPYRPVRQVWEMDDRVDIDQVSLGMVRVRRYPYTPLEYAPVVTPVYDDNGYITGYSYGSYAIYDYGVNLQVSQGTLYSTNEIRQRFVSETIFIQGQESIDLPYPVLAGLRFYILGVWYNIYGQPLWQVSPVGYPLTIPWPVIFDRRTNRLTFGQQVFGQLKYEYWADYLIYRYQPTYVGDSELYCTSSSDQYGHIMTFPRVFVEGRAPEVSVFQIQPPQPLNLEFELYRVTSEAVATNDGVWEKPEGFPDSGSFPGSSDVLDYTQGYLQIERVHEIGWALLHDQQRQARYSKSTDYAPMPIDYTNALKKGFAQAGGSTDVLRKTIDGFMATIQSNAQKAPERYAENVKAIPRVNLRTVRYEIKTGKPYETSDPAKETRYVMKQTLNKYGQPIEQVYWEGTQQYRIKLKVQIARAPTYDGAFRSQETINDYGYNAQAAQVNAMLRRVWQAIDWAGVKKIIERAYPTDLYEVDYSEITPLIP